MKSLKVIGILGIFAFGAAAGIWAVTADRLVGVDEAQAQDSPGTVAEVSPTQPGEREFYAPNSEALAPDEMRVIACGTGMPTTRMAQAAACFLVVILLYTN